MKMFDVYNRAISGYKSELVEKIEKLAQDIWNLYADEVQQTMFDQYDDEDKDTGIFDIVLNKDGVAVRKYLTDGHEASLFQYDLYDSLIVGIACDEVMNNYNEEIAKKFGC